MRFVHNPHCVDTEQWWFCIAIWETACHDCTLHNMSNTLGEGNRVAAVCKRQAANDWGIGGRVALVLRCTCSLVCPWNPKDATVAWNMTRDFKFGGFCVVEWTVFICTCVLKFYWNVAHIWFKHWLFVAFTRLDLQEKETLLRNGPVSRVCLYQ